MTNRLLTLMGVVGSKSDRKTQTKRSSVKGSLRSISSRTYLSHSLEIFQTMSITHQHPRGEFLTVARSRLRKPLLPCTTSSKPPNRLTNPVSLNKPTSLNLSTPPPTTTTALLPVWVNRYLPVHLERLRLGLRHLGWELDWQEEEEEEAGELQRRCLTNRQSCVDLKSFSLSVGCGRARDGVGMQTSCLLCGRLCSVVFVRVCMSSEPPIAK